MYGVNTNAYSPNGYEFEIQYHTEESFELKNGELHELYERQRKIKNSKNEEFIEIERRMFELSDKLTPPLGIGRVK